MIAARIPAIGTRTWNMALRIEMETKTKKEMLLHLSRLFRGLRLMATFQEGYEFIYSSQ